MNLVTLECPHCRGMMQVDASAAGQQIACPLCQGTMQVPAAEVLAAAIAPPAPPEGPSYAPPAPPEGPSYAPPAPPEWPSYAPPPASAPSAFAGGLAGVPMALMPLACPTCGGMFQVPPSTAGMQLPCPACGQLVTIPDAATMTAAATPAPEETTRDSPPLAPAAAAESMATNDPVLSLSLSLDLASLLPPGAAAAGAAPLGQGGALGPAWDVNTLLPPGAAEARAPGDQMPLPAAPRPILVSQAAAGGLAGATTAGVMALQDKPKIIGQGENEIEVRRLTPAEKARRKLIRNVILIIIGVGSLLAIVVYMSR